MGRSTDYHTKCWVGVGLCIQHWWVSIWVYCIVSLSFFFYVTCKLILLMTVEISWLSTGIIWYVRTQQTKKFQHRLCHGSTSCVFVVPPVLSLQFCCSACPVLPLLHSCSLSSVTLAHYKPDSSSDSPPVWYSSWCGTEPTPAVTGAYHLNSSLISHLQISITFPVRRRYWLQIPASRFRVLSLEPFHQ